LLLPYADALFVGTRVGVSQSWRRFHNTVDVCAFRELPAALGLRVRRASRSLHCQQHQRKTENLENMAQARLGGLSARPREIVLERRLSRLLPDRVRNGLLQASGCSRPRICRVRAKTKNRRRRPGVSRAQTPRRAEYRVLRPSIGRATSGTLRWFGGPDSAL